jgi:predicted solute-binding protein
MRKLLRSFRRVSAVLVRDSSRSLEQITESLPRFVELIGDQALRLWQIAQME